MMDYYCATWIQCICGMSLSYSVLLYVFDLYSFSLLSCSTSSSQRWVFITIFTPLRTVVTAGERYDTFCLSPSLFFLSFFPSLHFIFMVSGPCICLLGVKPLKPLYQDRKNNVTSNHTVKQTEYILWPLWESRRDKTPTPVHFNLPLTKHYLTLPHCEGREYYMIYAPEDQKHILSLQRAKQFTWASNEIQTLIMLY